MGNAIDTITASRPIRDPETIISNGSDFILGFFNPGNSSNRYVGVVTISEDGNLVVLNGQNEVIWSSMVSNSVTNVSTQLLDTGNIVKQYWKYQYWNQHMGK